LAGILWFGETVKRNWEVREESGERKSKLEMRNAKCEMRNAKDPPLHKANSQGWGTRRRKTKSKSILRVEDLPPALLMEGLSR